MEQLQVYVLHNKLNFIANQNLNESVTFMFYLSQQN